MGNAPLLSPRFPVQQKLAQLAKDQKKAQKRSKKNSVVVTPVIGEDLAVCIENQVSVLH